VPPPAATTTTHTHTNSLLRPQIRDKSPFYNKDKMMNSIPKVKGVILQSTLYTPK